MSLQSVDAYPSPSNTTGISGRYHVAPYSRDGLVAFFATGAFRARKSYIEHKQQIEYLDQYCRTSGVRTLIYEREYVDRHFSEDFGGYYVRCFEPYQKKCSRLHLFDATFAEDRIVEILVGSAGTQTDDLAQELGYRGFVVIKPLPETVVGRTCLVPAWPSGHFPTLHPQSAHLFGIEFNVKSLPFQEQDREVAACATSALWSVLHGTGRLFDHGVLSPLKITQNAGAKLPFFGRALPNDGLDMYQLAGVVRDLGLEAEILDIGNKFLLCAHAYAYLRGRVPVLLGIDFNLDRKRAPELHAVALVGYEFGERVAPATETGFRLVAAKIERFFAHDDGVGPFAPIDLDAPHNLVVTSWSGKGKRAKARLDQILVPLNAQIRTPFFDIFDGIMEFDHVLDAMRMSADGIPLAGRLQWDIYLARIRDVKKEILADEVVSHDEKVAILTASLPGFLWRAVGALGDERKLDLLFDATDLRQGRQLVWSISYDKPLEEALRDEFSTLPYVDVVSKKITKVIIEHYAGSGNRRNDLR